MLPLEFTRPALLLLFVPLALVLVAGYVRSLSDLSRRQRQASLGVRLLLSLLLVLALAGATWLRRTSQLFVVFAVDHSRSVGADAAEFADQWLSQTAAAQGRHRAAWMPFARQPGPLQDSLPARTASGKNPTAGDARTVPSPPDGHATNSLVVDSEGTGIAAAIDAAAAAIPPGHVPRIVLLSDGNATEGDAVAAAARAEIPIFTVPLPERAEPEVLVTAVEVPAEVREGEPFFVDVLVHSSHDDEGLVEIFRGDHRLLSERRAIKAGENQFRFAQTVERERLASFKVRISGLAKDTLLDNNSDSGLVTSTGRPRVLIIDSDPNLLRELVWALEDQGLLADVRPPQGLPDSLAGLQNYELLVLSNVPATAITPQQMDLIRTWVRDLGGGFAMLGGENSFGLGGYFRTPIEEILPVRCDFEQEKEKPSLGMVLILDRSGSMDGDPLLMARSAAQAAVELLSARDQVAVLAFDDQPYVISDLQSAANKGRLNTDIAGISAGGGTNMLPSMEQALEILSSSTARLKHVILLTDGQSASGDFQGAARRMAAARITLSTVAMGDADADLLKSLSELGRGRFYLADDASQVPQIFARETMTASKSAVDEQPFVPQVIRATPVLADLDLESAPFLLGCVRTRPKPTGEVILATEKGDPLLAWWRYGLGMSAAFTSDAKSRWSAEWLTWPGYGKFWTQVVRHLLRKNDARGIHVQTNRFGSVTGIVVDAVDGNSAFVNGAEVELTVIDPLLRQKSVSLKQTAPGRYATSVDTPGTGAYHLEIALRRDGQELARQSRGLMRGYSDELRLRPVDQEHLRRIASVSGGVANARPEDVFRARGESASQPVPLWPWLLTAAAFLLLPDIALRRIDLAVEATRWSRGL